MKSHFSGVPEPGSITEGHQRLCEFIREHRDEVLAAWEAEIRAYGPAEGMSEARLRDHLPQLLDEIATVTQSAHEGPAVPMGDSPRVHALDRLDEGFDLSLVAREYSYLRRAVLRLYARDAGSGEQVPLTEIRRFDFAIDEAVGVAVERYTRARQRTLEALDRIAAAALDVGDVDALIPKLLRVMLETTPAVDSAVLLLRDGEVLRIRAAVGVLEGRDIGFTVPIGRGFAGTIAFSKQPLAIRDASTDPNVLSQYIRDRKLRALYGVPLFHEGEVIGVAHMGSATAWEFSEEDKVLFRTMAHRAASLIVRAELVEQERRTRERAEEIAAQLQAVIDAAPNPIAFLDRQLRYVRVNAAVTRLSGHSAEEHIGAPPFHLNPTIKKGLEEVAQGAGPRSLELADSGRHYIFDIFPVRTESELLGVGGIVTDITERKATEQRLAASERKFSLLFQKAPSATALVRARDGTILDVNEAWVALFGIPRERALGKTGVELGFYVDPSERARLYAEFERNGSVKGFETRLVNSSGVEHVVRNNLDAFELEGERYIVGSIEDITERKRAEAQLQQSEAQFRSLANAIPQMAWIAEADGAVHWYNQRWYEYTGTTPEQMQGQGGWAWQQFHQPDQLPRVLQRFQEALSTGEGWEDTFPLRGKDGKYRWFLSRAMPLRDPSGHVVRWFGTNTDVTEQRESGEALRRIAEFRERLVGIVSHDLRSPLSAISMGAQQLVARAPTPWVLSVGTRIRRGADRMGRMISDLLDFTRIEATGTLPIERKPVDLREIISEIAEEFEESHSGRLRVELPSEPVRGEWDADRIGQVVSNLVRNAFEHGAVDAPVDLRLHDKGDRVALSVANRGPTIPKEALPTLFDPFRRGREARGTKGLGLGLHIVYEAVKAHGGTVEVRSSATEGTVFVVSLPRREARHS